MGQHLESVQENLRFVSTGLAALSNEPAPDLMRECIKVSAIYASLAADELEIVVRDLNDGEGFADRLKRCRKGRGLTRGRLSELSGVPARSIEHYESGNSSPAIDRIPSLASALGVSAGYLAFGGLSGEGE